MEIEHVVRQHKCILVDTAPFIYFIEQHERFGSISRNLFRLIDQKDDVKCIASVITLTEVLTKPLALGREDLVEAYRSALVDSWTVALYPVDELIAEKADELRAMHNIRTPDAIQLATAIENNATLFVTNDNGIPKLEDENIEIAVLADFTE